MTSNQIQYSLAVEEARHNKVTETEVTRHNQETEKIQARSNDINEALGNLQAQIAAEKNSIQKEYNDWYAKWTQASGTRKLEIEQQMADTQEKLANVDATYKEQLAELQARKNDIDAAAVTENKRHNQEMEALGGRNADLTEAWQNYQLYQFDVVNQRENSRLELDWRKFNLDKAIGEMKILELGAGIYEQTAHAENLKKNTELMPLSVGYQGLQGVGRVLGPLIPFLF